MAAVTVNSITYNVAGSLRQNIYNITIATSGDTLDTNLASIKQINFNDVAITKAVPTGDTIAFTTTGAVTGAEVMVTGY